MHRGRSKKRIAITIIFIVSAFISMGSFVGLYYFYLLGLIYLGISLIIISGIILLISICLFFSQSRESDIFLSRFEKKEEQKIEKETFEANKDEYEYIKRYFEALPKKAPSIKDLIEYLSEFEKISITDITNHFYPRDLIENKAMLGNVSWKTKEKIWDNYRKIKNVIELMISEKRIEGFLRQLDIELYYFNPNYNKN